MSFTSIELGEVADFINGYAFKPEDWHTKGKKIIRIQNLSDKSKPFNRTTKIVDSRYIVTQGTILVSWSATLDVFEWDESESALLNQHIFKVIPNEKLILKPFLKRVLKRAILAMLRYTHGSTMKHINRREFLETKIPLPPLEEQRRIAGILDKADEVRRQRQEAIRLTEELLKSLFLDMFGDPVTNPKGWEAVELKSQVAELRYGTSVKCHDVRENGDLPILRIPNIIDKKISWNDLKYAELESKEVSKLLLQPGDLLFVRTNGNPEYIARCALFEENSNNTLYASYLIRARLKSSSQFYPAFIRDIISFPTFRSRLVREAQTTAGNYNINTEGLGRLRLIKPPLEKQQTYLQLTHKLITRSKIQESHLKEINNIFNSLLQKAFRGEL